MDEAVRDGRIMVATVVWGAELERAANTHARRLTPGLNFRDVLLLRLVYVQDGPIRPGQLVGPVYTTAPGVAGSLRRLEAAGLVSRATGADRRTHPVTLTTAGVELAATIVEPWTAFTQQRLARLDEAERAELYRLLVKGSGLWDEVWPEEPDADADAAS